MRAAVTVWLTSHDETINGLAAACGVRQPILYRWYHAGRSYSTETLRLSDAMKIGRIVGVELRPASGR